MPCPDSGLREHELEAIEAKYGFRFPPDLRAFLGERAPISQWALSRLSIRHLEDQCGEVLTTEQPEPPTAEHGTRGWMNWRASDAEIHRRLAWPTDGVAPYFQNHRYWLPPWGERPEALEDRLQFLRDAPRLIPIAGQCYMAAEPCEAGNPVFSLYGIDIIVVGCDLADYVDGGRRSMMGGGVRHIRFWSDVLTLNWDGWASSAIVHSEETDED